MKKIYVKKTCGAIFAVLLAASLLTGCKDKNGNEYDPPETSDTLIEEFSYYTETRAIAVGDDYAINKINNKSPEDSLPGGYRLIDYNEENQGKLYLGEKSEIIIRAYNYNEDLLDLPIWADSACASIRIANMLNAQNTDFGDPENVKICGFDGIRYDIVITQYTKFDEEGIPLDEGSFVLKGRYYFFYSEQDAYAIMFDTREENWNEQVALLEEFINDLEITKTEY